MVQQDKDKQALHAKIMRVLREDAAGLDEHGSKQPKMEKTSLMRRRMKGDTKASLQPKDSGAGIISGLLGSIGLGLEKEETGGGFMDLMSSLVGMGYDVSEVEGGMLIRPRKASKSAQGKKYVKLKRPKKKEGLEKVASDILAKLEVGPVPNTVKTAEEMVELSGSKTGGKKPKKELPAGLQNYQRALKFLKESYGLTHKEAQEAIKKLKQKRGGAWYDDLAKGFKMGVDIGESVLPLVL